MIFLWNVLLTVARPTYSAALNATTPPQAHLAGVRAFIDTPQAHQLMNLPEGAGVCYYVAQVDAGTDIAMGDRITAITLKDGRTPWPGDYQRGSGVAGADPTSLWNVLWHNESAPTFFSHRLLYLGRTIGQGPLHSI